MDFHSLVDSRDSLHSVKFYANYDRLDPVTVIKLVEDEIFRALRVWQMRKSVRFTLPEGQDYYPVPEGFLEPILLKNLTYSIEIENSNPDDLERRRQYLPSMELAPGVMNFYSIFNDNINFDFRADKDYELSFAHFSTDGHRLSESNPETFLTKNHSDLLIAGIRKQGAILLKDSREQQIHEAQVNMLLREINVRNDNVNRGIVGLNE